jgi:RNA polymerase sigma-B factor
VIEFDAQGLAARWSGSITYSCSSTTSTNFRDEDDRHRYPSRSLEGAGAPRRDLRTIGRIDEGALFARYRRERDSATREELVERYLPLARHLARRYRGRAELDDLDQVASLALLKALDRFDPDRGIAFSSFAVPTILGELKRYFRDHGWTVRVPRELQEFKLRLDGLTQELTGQLGRSPTAAELADRAGDSVEHVLEALATSTAHFPDSLHRPLAEDGREAIEFLPDPADSAYEHVEDALVVDGLLGTLSDRERQILQLRFAQDLTQAEIGQRLGVSQMHISRLIRQSLQTLQTTAAQRSPPR